MPAFVRVETTLCCIDLADTLSFSTRLVFSVFALGGLGAYGVLSEVDVQGDDIDLAAHWGVGAKFFVSENFGLRVDGRQILTGWAEQGAEDGQTSLHYEVLGGLVFTFGRHAGPPEDQDDDGIPDPNDKCPNRIGVRPDGCPPQDTDGDGVADPKDRCPTVKARSSDGCPVDTDQDGVPDSQDKCPSTAAKTTHGCPDSDDDGVPDDRDKCPTTSAQTTSGCPDSDNDGVLDDQDACADVAGTLANGCPDPDPDKDGIDTNQDRCPFDAGRPPDGCPEDVQELLGAVRGVTFRSGGAKLRSTSITVLTRAFSVLQAHPSLKLEIRGHTDSAGNADANLRLSQLRANVVRAYLIDLGVDRNRLTAVGFGEALPIKNNRTRAGRAANRRIEFKLIE